MAVVKTVVTNSSAYHFYETERYMVMDMVTGEYSRMLNGEAVGTLDDAVEFVSSAKLMGTRLAIVKLNVILH